MGICSSGIGDDVCRGCHRFAYEVIDWNSYSDQQRGLVLARLEDFLLRVMRLKIERIELDMFYEELERLGIDVDTHRDPYLSFYDLLKARQLRELNIAPSALGIRLRSTCRYLNLAALQESIEKELAELSTAHFERYIAPGIIAARK